MRIDLYTPDVANLEPAEAAPGQPVSEAQPNPRCDARGSKASAAEGDNNAAHDCDTPSGRTLTALEEAMLVFERSWWKYPGAKEAAIRDRFELSPTRYYQILNVLIDRPEAAAFDPLTVHRLLRLRRVRREQREPIRLPGRTTSPRD